MTSTVIRTERSARFSAPEVPTTAVGRRPVLTRLITALQKRLVVVVAPPGYGKTILLAQAARSMRQERVRWITIDSDHEDVTHLCRDVADALGPWDGDGFHPSPLAEPPLAALHRFGAFLAELPPVPPTVLVLDDLHRLTRGEALEVIAVLAERAPRTVHLAIATRVDPPLPLYRLHLTEMLTELRQRDIAFSTAEAATLLRTISGREVPPRMVERLVERTEGWAAGLHLAAMSLREQEDIEAFVEAFTGDDRQVAGYLTDAVLERIPAHEREFLLSTCLLDDLTPELCDAITHQRDGHRMLEHLTRRSMFVAPVPNSDGSYRYHGLFRAYLRHRLHDEDAQRERDLLLETAAWYLARGDLAGAVRYFASVGAWSEVTAAAMDAGSTMLSTGRYRDVTRWLSLVPADLRRRRDDVALVEAVAAVASGEVPAASQALDALTAVPRAPETMAVESVIRALHALNGDDVARAASLSGPLCRRHSIRSTSTPRIDGLTSRPGDLRAASRVIHGSARTYLGDLEAARGVLESEVDADYPLWQVEANASLALVELWSGRLTEAERCARRALVLGEELLPSSQPAMATATIASAAVVRCRDDLRTATALLDEVKDTSLAHRARLRRCLLAIEDAELALARGDRSAAQALASGYRAPAEPTFPDHLRTQWCVAEARLLLAVGDVRGAASSLDEAPTSTPELARAGVQLALARGDLVGARTLIAGWPDGPEPITSLGRRMWQAVVEHLDGNLRSSLDLLAAVAVEAEAEWNVALLRGEAQIGAVRALYRVQPTPFLRTVIEQLSGTTRRRPVRELAEQLTERECAVLVLLPTRLSNLGIAENMGVSVNTVKTHLRHVYQKLQVENRGDAIAVAEKLHLL